MPGIDDPIDAVKKQYLERPTGADVLMDVVTDVVAQLCLPVGMVKVLMNFVSKREAESKVELMLQAFEECLRDQGRRIEKFPNEMFSPEFIETMLVAAEKALRTANLEKIKRFGRVLGHEWISDGNARSYEDAADFIRILSELGEADIEVLSVIHAFQTDLVSDGASLSGLGLLYDGAMVGVRGGIAERGIESEEFFSRCSRLHGYGLLHRVRRGTFYDQSYEVEGFDVLLTRNGKKLMEILGNSPELMAEAAEHHKKVQLDIERLNAGEIDSFPQPYRARQT